MAERQMIDGVLYEFSTVAQYRCRNCYRVTLSGLCGCQNAEPVYVSDTLYGVPVTGEIVAKEVAAMQEP